MHPRLAYAAFMLLALAVVPARAPAACRRPAVRWRAAAAQRLAAGAGGVRRRRRSGRSCRSSWSAPTSVARPRRGWPTARRSRPAWSARTWRSNWPSRCSASASRPATRFALPLALALAVGRWGCFFNGCCYGTPTTCRGACDFGDGVPRHPTQVYESLFHLRWRRAAAAADAARHGCRPPAAVLPDRLRGVTASRPSSSARSRRGRWG